MMDFIIADATGGGSFMPMVPIFIMLGVMMFLMFRSQKKQAQKRQEMLSSIRSGSKVVTAGGIYATVKEVSEDSYKIEIAKDVIVEIGKNGVVAVVDAEKAI